jgi:hypothetical protein
MSTQVRQNTSRILALTLIIACNLLSSIRDASAADSTDLSVARRKQLAGTSFYCPIGRAPMLDSSDSWQIRAIPGCGFNGPLDTKINRLKLEPPILNPLLTLATLKTAVQSLGAQVDSESATSLRFRLPAGQSFTAALSSAKDMQDPLFHFNVIPLPWGQVFVTIAATNASDIPALIALAKTQPANALFWKNPQFNDEAPATAHLARANTYHPLPLLSKCGDGHEWTTFGDGAQALLIAGDLHNPPQTEFFKSMLATRPFAWVGLEIPNDMTPDLDAFLNASDSAGEERPLIVLTYRYPKNLIEPTKSVLRALKALRVQIVLLDSNDAYFNFPFTNVSFHGMVMSTRNSVWARQLPSNWIGTALMLGGLDHFIDTPSSDFQDYASDRFPGIKIGLISPYETCAP